MKINMGSTDRIGRLLLVIMIILAYYTGMIHGLLAGFLFIVAGVFVLTSVFGKCPMYALFDFNTCKHSN